MCPFSEADKSPEDFLRAVLGAVQHQSPASSFIHLHNMWAPIEAFEGTIDPQHSYLDDDDISAPGTAAFDKRTGDPDTDFALFTIAKYALSEEKQERKLFASCLPRTIAGLKSVVGDYFMGLVEALLEDEPEIAMETLDRLPESVEKWIKQPQCYKDLIEKLFPLLGQALYEPNEVLAKKAADAYGKLIRLLVPEDRGTIGLTQLLLIAHEEEKEQAKILAIRLLNESAPAFGRGLSEQFLSSELIALADDSSEAVRRTVASSMSSVYHTVKPPIAQSKLLPVLERLSKDPKISVRRCLVEALPELAQTNPQTLSSVFASLLKDKNKGIKQLAAQKAGPLAAAFAGVSGLPEEMVKAFAEQAANTQSEECALACAQYLPAVVLALGPGRWNDISKSFLSLANSPHKAARKTVAACVHELAKVIGQNTADKDLVPVYTSMTGKNEMEEVKYIALSHLAEFLMQISPEKRTGFSDLILWMAMPRPNWRFRELLAKQLVLLAVLFDIDTVRLDLWSSALRLVADPVAAVYIPAAQGIGALTTRLLRDTEDMREEITGLVGSYASSLSCAKRQLFVHMAGQSVSDSSVFREIYADAFLKCAQDPIPTVRLLCAEIARKLPAQFEAVLQDLRKDTDPEISLVAAQDDQEGQWLVTNLLLVLQTQYWKEGLEFPVGAESMACLKGDCLLDGSGFPLWSSS